MKFALNLKDDGRVLSATKENFAAPDAVLVDNLPESNLSDYRWQDNAFVYDPLQEPELEPEPTTEEILLELAADHEERLCLIELGI